MSEIDGEWFFVLESGREVKTDALGKAIWESLPGERENVRKKAAANVAGSSRNIGQEAKEGSTEDEAARPERLADDFLAVLAKAGIAETDESGAAMESSALPGAPEKREPVSIVVVTYNGAAHVRDCFGSLLAQSYPNLEIIAVDSGSTDGTADLIRKDHPAVRIVPFAKNVHFAKAVNEGIRHAGGRYIFILNQDVEVDRDCVARLAARLWEVKGRKVGAVVPMMKFFDLRGFVNGLGNHIRERGWGSDNFIGFVDVGQFRDLEEVPSACFGAVMLDRDAVADVGLLDEEYTAFYEDVDWSFRCWMKDWRIVPESRAVVYHKFGASYPERGKLKLVVRNRLRLVLKLFVGRKRRGFLGRYMGEDVRNFLALIRRGEGGRAGAYLAAYASFVGQVPGILFKRRKFFASLRHARRDGRTPSIPLRESDILAKNPDVFSALDEKGRPVLDTRIIAEYYRPLLRKRGT